GLITFASNNPENMARAIEWVKSLVEEPEVGKIYDGTVVTIKDFGAFVNIMPSIDGMLHISQISERRLDKVTDVLHEGDKIRVKLQAIDDRGKLSLTMRGVEQN
ncbi:MAG: S1 RNA-binding domain-containing protein, partial [Candidatus Nomurabacteria bacterium]|nr:S1 RNA-binding domain-containing protein [Candidatus Nomurabacteria bacterium]